MVLPTAGRAQGPVPQEFWRVSAAGNYLAAREATRERDAGAASIYYRAVLKGDPKNPELIERTFLASLADGDIDEAVKLADRLVQIDRGHRVARLVLGVRAIKQKQYQVASQQLAESVRDPIAGLTATLLSAWTLYGKRKNAPEVTLSLASDPSLERSPSVVTLQSARSTRTT